MVSFEFIEKCSFTILLDSDLFVKFKNFLDERGVNRG